MRFPSRGLPVQPLPGQHKLFDGCSRGWLAHLRHGLVFVKVFNRERPVNFAPGESEVQIYATAEYQELEQQGAYRLLAPGERYQWTVHWLLRPAPPSRGGFGRRTEELLEWVDELAGRVHSQAKA
jgi:hypothetical protein